jgi:N-acetyl-alpha-D-muramate 1-phosphate uridylyltransferase
MQCVLLAGGLGTRMRHLTEAMPKALIAIGDRPFIDYQLAWLATHGVSEVVLSIGYRGEMVRAHVGAGDRFGIPVRYVDEGADLRGTGGALRLALEQGVLDGRFFVTYGDSFLPIDFAAVERVFVASRKRAAMTILKNGGRWDTSNVIVEDGELVLYDKQRRDRPAQSFEYIDYGLSALQRSVVEELVPSGEKFDLADVFYELSVRRELLGVEVTERFYEIGSPAGLADFTSWVEDARAKGELTWLKGAG